MRKAILLTAAVAALLCPARTAAQSTWGSVLEAGATHKIVSGLSAGATVEHRSFDNFGKTERWQLSAALNYRVCKNLKTDAGYCFIRQNRLEDGWENRNRWYASATGSVRWNRFELSLRERFQSTHRNGVSEYNKNGRRVRANPKHVLKSRLELEYNIDKCRFTPFCSVELFHTLNDPDGNGLEKCRTTVGSEYAISRRQKISLFARHIHYDGAKDDAESDFQIGLSYAIKL